MRGLTIHVPPELSAAAKEVGAAAHVLGGELLRAAWWDGFRTGAVAAVLMLLVLFTLWNWRKCHGP